MRVHIINGNSKLGSIPNVSLLPIVSCGKGVPCAKDCYAQKFITMKRKHTITAWTENLYLAQKDTPRYFREIEEYLTKPRPKKPIKFFRWHVAGDFLDQDYLDCVKILACLFPSIKFLAFTKRHDLNYSKLPPNLAVVFSMWPGWGSLKAKMPRAWMDDGTETRVPADAIQCPGGCESCGMCWSLKGLGKDVVFPKH
jgi:hypothetical protein